jgi:hypothetical protein
MMGKLPIERSIADPAVGLQTSNHSDDTDESVPLIEQNLR